MKSVASSPFDMKPFDPPLVAAPQPMPSVHRVEILPDGDGNPVEVSGDYAQ